ncbi:hypothetical protein SAY86_000427 [Trapa natans]|uniref:AIG1-type G domain-containing protein n=1 Tax=Trapa natans TaxID=22666 RepID=A0AAN7MAX5_TRANT|nr:hypothetical protein SAY86_000427 [Trapa natans]
MENSIEISGGSMVDERMNEGLEVREDDQVVVTAMGGKVNDGEEVFEEAVDSQDAEVIPGTTDEIIGHEHATDMNADVPLVDGSSSSEQEVEKFEEAIGTPTFIRYNGEEMEFSEAVGVEYLANRVDIDGVEASCVVDEGGTEKVVTHDPAVEGNEEGDSKLVAETKNDFSGDEEQAINALNEQINVAVMIDPAVEGNQEDDSMLVAEGKTKDAVFEDEEQISNAVNEQIGSPEVGMDQSEFVELTGLKEEEKGVDGSEASGQENADIDGVLEGEIPPKNDEGDMLNESKREAEGQMDEKQDSMVASDENHLRDIDAMKYPLLISINGHIDSETRSVPSNIDLGPQDINANGQKDVLSASHAEQHDQCGSNGKMGEDNDAVATDDKEMNKQQNISADSPFLIMEGSVNPEVGSSIALGESVDGKSKRNLGGESISTAKNEYLESQPPVVSGGNNSPEKLKKKNIRDDEATEKVQWKGEAHTVAKAASSSTEPSNHTSTALIHLNSAPACPSGLEVGNSIALGESVDGKSKRNLDEESISITKKESLESQPPVSSGDNSLEKLKKKNIKDDEASDKVQKQREAHALTKIASSSTEPSNHTSTVPNPAPACPSGLEVGNSNALGESVDGKFKMNLDGESISIAKKESLESQPPVSGGNNSPDKFKKKNIKDDETSEKNQKQREAHALTKIASSSTETSNHTSTVPNPAPARPARLEVGSSVALGESVDDKSKGNLDGESISIAKKESFESQPLISGGNNSPEMIKKKNIKDDESTQKVQKQGEVHAVANIASSSTEPSNRITVPNPAHSRPAGLEVGNSVSLGESVDGESISVAKNESLEPQPHVSDGNNSLEKFKKKTIKGEEATEKVQRQRGAHAVAKIASSSAEPSNHTPTVPNPAPACPAGLGQAAPLLEPAPRAAAQQPRVNAAVSSQQIEDATNGEAEEHDDTREKLQMIRVKFLRLAHRLGQTPHNVVVAQVLYRLGLAEQLRGRNGGRVGAFSFDRASAMAEQLEASGQEPLDFSCTIMVLGKTGVGKSATINSIFDEMKFSTDAFDVGTRKVQDVTGTVQGIKVRVIDTPGLFPSWTDQRHNEKILQSVKRFIKKTPPDIVLYLDRLDMQSRDLSDMPLLRTITEIFGPSIWFNAIVVFTHAASAPPDGPNGTASSYDMFVTQRSHVVQQAIRQAAGDMRLMNPVCLVENHSACRTNRAGQRVLPNGQVWKPHLLLLSFASKILAEANALLKLQDNPPGKFSTARSRAPPLPFLLSSLLQPRSQLKLPDDQFGDEDGMDDDLYESSDSEEENEYDELPPFKRLTKAQLAKLNRAQKKAYFEELEYREKLFMKKQLREERKRRRMMKKMAGASKDQAADLGENVEEESGGAASVPVPMPDLALPASFDSDNPTHRYRYLDTANQWLVRPTLESHGWDHDVGYEGVNVERLFVVKDKVPISLSGQITKDKKEANVQMELASSIKHGEGKATSLGFDMQTVGKDLAYTLRSETRFSNHRRNKAAAGLSITLLNDALSAGFKVEDKFIINKCFRLLVTGGAITSRGDIAYGGSLDATLRDKDYPLGRSLFTLGLSVMDWHGDLAIGGNVQSQFPIGRSTNLITRANLNNRGAGQVSVRINSSEQLQIALLGLVPLIKKLMDYRQQLQFGQ